MKYRQRREMNLFPEFVGHLHVKHRHYDDGSHRCGHDNGYQRRRHQLQRLGRQTLPENDQEDREQADFSGQTVIFKVRQQFIQCFGGCSLSFECEIVESLVF